MADRSFHTPETQGTRHVIYGVTVQGANPTTNAPTFVEGDTLGASVGSYLVATKVATGKYRFKTTNPFLGLVSVSQPSIQMATPGNEVVQVLKPTQNSDKTWQFEIWTYVNAAGTFTLTDIVAGDYISFTMTLRNNGVRP
jgi:hypothetical protein